MFSNTDFTLTSSFYYTFPTPLPLARTTGGWGSLVGRETQTLLPRGPDSQWSHFCFGCYGFPLTFTREHGKTKSTQDFGFESVTPCLHHIEAAQFPLVAGINFRSQWDAPFFTKMTNLTFQFSETNISPCGCFP